MYVDEVWAARVSQAQILSSGLYTGLTVTTAQWSGLTETASEEAAYSQALNFLSYRPRSAREVEQNLSSHGVERHVVTKTLERLEALGYVNDAQFAEFWISNRCEFSPRGPRVLKQELYQKGLPASLIEQSLEGIPDAHELALSAGRRKLRSFSGCDEGNFFKKMLGFLGRRGFGYEESSTAAHALWTEVCETREHAADP